MGVKLGQKWAVKDGNLLASNQVGSRFFNKEFDFSRASNGTYVDRDGLLKTAELYNKFTNSEDFSAWSKNAVSITLNDAISPNGVQNASFLQENTTNNSHFIFQSASTATIDYTISIFAKHHSRILQVFVGFGDVSGNPYANFDLENGVLQNYGCNDAFIQDVGGGWYRCGIVVTSVVTSNFNPIFGLVQSISSARGQTYVGDGISGVYIFGAQLVEGTEPLDYQYTNGLQGLPRISFEDGVGHLLLEPQRTNLIPYSEDFTQWILQSNVNLTQNAAQSPEGLNNAFKYNISANIQRAVDYNLLLSSGNTYTFSLYVKPIVDTTIRIRDGAGWVEEIEVLAANGWQRIESTYSVSSDAYNIGFFDVSGDDGDRFYFYGAQIEVGSYKTSYIKTEGTSVTRLADVCNNSGSAQDFNSEEGVLYAEILKRQDDNDNFILLSINDGSGNDDNSVTIGFDSDDDFYARIQANGTNILVSQNIAANKDEYYKMALKYNTSGDNALWINGVEVATGTTSFAFANPLTTLNFDYITGTSLPFYGKVRNVQAFTEALGDTELMTLTGGDGSLNGLFTAYKSRVEADGGYLEAETCLINELKELL